MKDKSLESIDLSSRSAQEVVRIDNNTMYITVCLKRIKLLVMETGNKIYLTTQKLYNILIINDKVKLQFNFQIHFIFQKVFLQLQI